MNSDQYTLLEEILAATTSQSDAVNAQKFRAKNHVYLNDLDELEQQHYIENTEGRYRVKIRTLSKLDKPGSKANHIIFLCELLFKVLRGLYLEHAGDKITLNSLAKEADISRSDVNRAFPYLSQGGILGGWTSNFEDNEAFATPSEQILRYNSFQEVVHRYDRVSSSFCLPVESQSSIPSRDPFDGHDYISQIRISEIEMLKSDDFDFGRLIQICKEINSNAHYRNYLALGALIRILLDHVPPVFGFKTFKEVSASYQSGKSIKASLKNLENSSRNISDGLLHQRIRKKETLPTLNQVNFAPDIDVLLSEIVLITQ
ncbi:hypothetical protein [Marinimicrobium agarilyticum]|uniref:hypothetical protein n=1 Tax=Marinimicrobium agarilyticum TaxID=306546 RepID=UPI000686CD96|nr:hypothetical protein [Marinimicrobium agarilyticum]